MSGLPATEGSAQLAPESVARGHPRTAPFGGFGRVLAVMRKEFIHIRRDPRTLAIVLILPVFQLVVFGYAVTNDVEHLPLAVLDQDRTAASRRLIAAYGATTYFDIRYEAASEHELGDLLDRGQARVGLTIAPGYAEKLAGGERVEISLIIDGS